MANAVEKVKEELQEKSQILDKKEQEKMLMKEEIERVMEKLTLTKSSLDEALNRFLLMSSYNPVAF